MATQNLESIIENVDKLDTDNPADLNELVNAITGGALEAEPDSDTPKADAPKPDAKADDPPAAPNPAEPAPASAAPAAPAAPATQEADGVLAKDGKNVLPWSVLEGTRKQKAEAEARATQAESQLEETRKELEALKAGKPAADAPKTMDEIAQQIADLKAQAAATAEEAPWLAETQTKTIATLEAMLAVMQAGGQRAPEPATAKADPADDPVRAAIDATPALAHFEANNPAMFEYAVQVDNMLKTQPAWKGKPLTERFLKVVDIVRATHGDEVLPPELRQAAVTPAAKPAEKPAEKTLPSTDVPAISSLTDLPGGTPTAMNPLQAMESASPTAIAQSLAKLENPDDIIRFVTQ